MFFPLRNSDFDGLLRLQRMYKSIPKTAHGTDSFQVEVVKEIKTAKEVIQFLIQLEKINRNSLKRVVLDCSTTMAKVRTVKFRSNSRRVVSSRNEGRNYF